MMSLIYGMTPTIAMERHPAGSAAPSVVPSAIGPERERRVEWRTT